MPDVTEHPHLHWYPNGQSALSGPLLQLFERVDGLFAAWAEQVDALAIRVPIIAPVAWLDRIDYLRSFPHLITFPIALAADDGVAAEFCDRGPIDEDGHVRIPKSAPISDALTPAACSHVYPRLAEQSLDRASHWTLLASCFRREAFYLPLRRQWNFSMREIVCVGAPAEVTAFIERHRELLDEFVQKHSLPLRWEVATDPFFRGEQNPKYVLQKVQPVKWELVYGEDLAIASINAHHETFGKAFDIEREDATAHSACVAFGVERWLYFILDHFGMDESKWPAVGMWKP